ncbi:MAG TPA: hypothetical protein VHA76_16315 [Solirubrobacterales bacterium]|nr:hypothetical protein [Solirubrobacterales bacterium]
MGSNLPAAINAALVYYVGKLNSGRPPARIPDFLRVQGKREGEEGAAPPGGEAPIPRPEVEVPVDERIEAALAADAGRQGVGLPELAGHAVLVYLAELDLIGDPDPARTRRARSSVGPVRRSRGAPH